MGRGQRLAFGDVDADRHDRGLVLEREGDGDDVYRAFLPLHSGGIRVPGGRGLRHTLGSWGPPGYRASDEASDDRAEGGADEPADQGPGGAVAERRRMPVVPLGAPAVSHAEATDAEDPGADLRAVPGMVSGADAARRGVAWLGERGGEAGDRGR